MYCLSISPSNLKRIRELYYIPVGLGSENFGKEWMKNEDASYIPANKQNKNLVKNPLTFKEAELIQLSLIENTFRYDASELMERKIGADALWVALRNYIDMGRERAYREIEDITEELDSNF